MSATVLEYDRGYEDAQPPEPVRDLSGARPGRPRSDRPPGWSPPGRPPPARPEQPGGTPGPRLAEIRAAGLVRGASERAGVEQTLPVSAALRPLLPGASLRRGATIAVNGSTSLLFTLLAEASRAGSWCAAVGLPRWGLVAAAEAGIEVRRLALVPRPGTEWASVVAALLDGVDIVVTATPGLVPARLAERLAARARQRGGVLVPVGRWPGADVTLEAVRTRWHGLGDGQGRLRAYEVEVLAYGRGAASRPRRARLGLPGSAIVHDGHTDIGPTEVGSRGLRLAG
jgi:hypothetical protein